MEDELRRKREGWKRLKRNQQVIPRNEYQEKDTCEDPANHIDKAGSTERQKRRTQLSLEPQTCISISNMNLNMI